MIKLHGIREEKGKRNFKGFICCPPSQQLKYNYLTNHVLPARSTRTYFYWNITDKLLNNTLFASLLYNFFQKNKTVHNNINYSVEKSFTREKKTSRFMGPPFKFQLHLLKWLSGGGMFHFLFFFVFYINYLSCKKRRTWRNLQFIPLINEKKPSKSLLCFVRKNQSVIRERNRG
jgi:hypothetical protein